MPSKKKSEIHTMEASPFYRIGRQVDLVPLTGNSLKNIKHLAQNRAQYYWRKEQKIGEKLRSISCPIGPLRTLHEELQSRLNRIKQPDYLYSPRRGHTARKNADLHEKSVQIAKLDIRQFYPSTTSEHVFRFFRHRMNMVDDVAGLLTKLCTIDERLPFGSPLSPILCTLVHRDLFDQVSVYCRSLSLIMSLWVDDITISGDKVSNQTLWTVRQMIHAKGLKSHKAQLRHTHLGAIVTGHYLRPNGISPANKHHLGVRDALAALDVTLSSPERLKLLYSLIGKTNYARGICPLGSAVRLRLDKRRDWLHGQRRFIQRRSFITTPARPIPVLNNNPGLPWDLPSETIHSEYVSALSGSAPSREGSISV